MENNNFCCLLLNEIGLWDIKQIYHALFRGPSEIMDPLVARMTLFSSGLRPSEKSAIPATAVSIISTRATQCMVYLFSMQKWYYLRVFLPS